MDDIKTGLCANRWCPLVRYVATRGLLIVMIAGSAYAVGDGLIKRYVHEANAPTSNKDYALQAYRDEYGNDCNIAVVRLENDELYATDAMQANSSGGFGADSIVAQIEQAKQDKNIRGVLMEVDSPGGSPVGGEIISKALKALGKPSVALIYDEGDSAAYFAATGASTIIASPFSSVGDIGVTSSFVDYSGSDSKNGDTFEQISSGKYKDAGNPDKPLTQDELALLRANVDVEYRTLVGEIAENRNMSTTTVTELADGAAIPGSEALGKGLIDSLGNLTTAKEWFSLKLPGTSVVLCDPNQTDQ